jgi:hypothetical protein
MAGAAILVDYEQAARVAEEEFLRFGWYVAYKWFKRFAQSGLEEL